MSWWTKFRDSVEDNLSNAAKRASAILAPAAHAIGEELGHAAQQVAAAALPVIIESVKNGDNFVQLRDKSMDAVKGEAARQGVNLGNTVALSLASSLMIGAQNVHGYQDPKDDPGAPKFSDK